MICHEELLVLLPITAEGLIVDSSCDVSSSLASSILPRLNDKDLQRVYLLPGLSSWI